MATRPRVAAGMKRPDTYQVTRLLRRNVCRLPLDADDQVLAVGRGGQRGGLATPLPEVKAAHVQAVTGVQVPYVLLLISDGQFGAGHALLEQPLRALLVGAVVDAVRALHRLRGLVVNDYERGRHPAARPEDPADLADVTFHVGGEHVGEDREQAYDVEAGVGVRQHVLGGFDGPARVVFGVEDIGVGK